MGFYDLSKQERAKVVADISSNLLNELERGELKRMIQYFSDEDTYIRKSAYLSLGKIYLAKAVFRSAIITVLETLFLEEDFKIRQTVINAAGEIGKSDFECVRHFFEKGLFDGHHSVRNAVIGSIKKMAEVNPDASMGEALPAP